MSSHWGLITGVDPDKRRVAIELRRRLLAAGASGSTLVGEADLPRNFVYRALAGERKPSKELIEVILALRPAEAEPDYGGASRQRTS